MMARTTTPPQGFASQHIPHVEQDRKQMLDEVGYLSVADLMADAMPADVVATARLSLPEARSEGEATAQLRAFSEANDSGVPLLGLGFHRSVTPAVIRRQVLENPAWYTAYTPYQAEISQGRLEVLFHFQTMVSELTGMQTANASLLDEATAAAEGMALCYRQAHDRSRTAFLVDHGVHPHVVDVVSTRAEALDLQVWVGDLAGGQAVHDSAFGMLLSYPGTDGTVADLAPAIAAGHSKGVRAVVVADLLACTVLKPPGEMGADVVVGHTQRFGLPLWYGGPHAGFIAVREEDRRSLPGRLVGVSVDAARRPALRLALQTREQHIRRERATSNICTAQSLPAIVSTLYAIHHGPDGLSAIAERVHGHATTFAASLAAAGVALQAPVFFDTVTVSVPGRAADHVEAACTAGLELRQVDADTVIVAFDETTDDAILAQALKAFGAVPATGSSPLPEALRRATPFLRQPVFTEYRSETALMRLIRRLGDRDLALDRSMIPLGSCTMKLNAAAQLDPVSWPGFADLHPFLPASRVPGTHAMMAQLATWLLEITGFDALSFQPNAGSQGEFAGLLAIRRYHLAHGEPGRTLVLIPASAHGTNAASAAMAGFDVQVVACDEEGNVDLHDLARLCEESQERLAALMITYPSTHGVFEATIRQMCDLVHQYGGQVYLDGANLNAMVGWARPADLGADVAHLNLHKTFAIPHGGGGPGVGPIGLRSHLAPYQPGHVTITNADGSLSGGAVAGAPYGSAGILPISWTYLAMLGRDGLEAATAAAVLAANYIAERLDHAFPVLYRGPGGRVAHECILDIRPITTATGVTAEDIAKRLIDYGFHAPTMSFPVPGTLMVEPTESEPLEELDRFCEAMLSIRREIHDIAAGQLTLADSPLRRAPHPVADVVADDWDRPYTRQQAACTDATGTGLADKYWPPVSRIDNAGGDRTPICACPPLTDWRDTLEENDR